MSRVGIVFDLVQGANKETVRNTLQQLRFGPPSPNAGDPLVLESVEPLAELSGGVSAVEAGFIGLSRELEEENALQLAYQARALAGMIEGVINVRTSILPK